MIAAGTPAVAAPPAPLELIHLPGWLVAQFATEHTTASWAIAGGGMRRAHAVAWHQIRDAELLPDVDPAALLRDRLAAIGAPGAVGLLTTCRLDHHADVTVRYGELTARCIATVGLGNALRAGDPPGAARIGTINLLCRLDVPLSAEAQLEALALASEARALAVREALVPSVRTGLPASGTGTDCIVIAAPVGDGPAVYAGKHTALGHVIGAAVYEATWRGVERCQRERSERSQREQSERSQRERSERGQCEQPERGQREQPERGQREQLERGQREQFERGQREHDDRVPEALR